VGQKEALRWQGWKKKRQYRKIRKVGELYGKIRKISRNTAHIVANGGSIPEVELELYRYI
jgi:hypothetical protein